MRYFILLLGLIALCSMTPLERTVRANHSDCVNGGGTAVNVGSGFFITAGHVSDENILTIEGNIMTLKDFDLKTDWAILYSDVYVDSPDVGTAPIVIGETCWYWVNGREYPIVFYFVDNDGEWVFYGQPPAFGISGTGIFNAKDELVAIVTARIESSIQRFGPSGIATPVLGLIDPEEKEDKVEPPKVQPPAPLKPS